MYTFIRENYEFITTMAFLVAAVFFGIAIVIALVLAWDWSRNRKLSPDSQYKQDQLTDFHRQQEERQAEVSKAMAPETLNPLYIKSEKRKPGRPKGSKSKSVAIH